MRRHLGQTELAQGGQGIFLLLVGAVRDIANGHAELVGVLKKLLRPWNQRGRTVTLAGQPGVPGVIGVAVGKVPCQQGAVINDGFIQIGNDGQLRRILRGGHCRIQLQRRDVVGLQLQGLNFRRLLLKAQRHGELRDCAVRLGLRLAIGEGRRAPRHC